jgi:hypothetical protein
MSEKKEGKRRCYLFYIELLNNYSKSCLTKEWADIEVENGHMKSLVVENHGS